MDKFSTLWFTDDRRRWFLLPSGPPCASGSLAVYSLDGRCAGVDPEWAVPFEIGEAQARSVAHAQLGDALGELRARIDEGLDSLRQRASETNTAPLPTARGAVTADALPALCAFVAALPGVIRQSLSGDHERGAMARATMVALQQRLQAAGIGVDDRAPQFVDRLVQLREGSAPADSRPSGDRDDNAPPPKQPTDP